MTAKIKGILYLAINLVMNGTIFVVVPPEYKPYVFLVANSIQVFLAFIDPTYVIQKLGISKSEYLGRIANK